ncbi:hypothetical protein BJF83_19655 [Nocardiopsis sp. CNR-923]|uniref:hypothetical protein n=1 Tax=Nocardiopsis sp. CNR-923 TaxID=1904965 RepID=UPI00096893E3|nr:hypothetical protein [Nocardiopsis sp. CNR-923]OLT26999.1 hypothetical protein BJF83_19655 [Nocardiopsis sp. CNR-923]
MSEDVPRPVIDPTLPEASRERIARDSHAPEPPPRRRNGDVVTRSLRVREGAVQVLAVGFTAGLAAAAGGWPLGLLITAVILMAQVLVFVCAEDTHPATRILGVTAGAGAVVSAPVLAVAAHDAVTAVPWVVFGVFAALVGTDAVTARVREPLADHEGLVVLPDDVSEVDHAHLVAVQHTIDRVVAARNEIGGDSLDTDRALVVLREQEWRIASLLARQRELRRAHLRRWQRAASPRVREALRPQRAQLEAVDAAVRARVEQIAEYGRLVDRAVAAHREWEQCQEAVDSTVEYTEHLASAAFLDARPADLRELTATTEAARRVRDERVRRLVDHGLTAGVPGSWPDPDAGASGGAAPGARVPGAGSRVSAGSDRLGP